MAKWIVCVLGLQGRGKKVFKAGEEITDAHLPDGNGKELAKLGYLKAAKLSAKEQKLEDASNDVKTAKAKLKEATDALSNSDNDEERDELAKAVDAAEDELTKAEEALNKLTK